MIKKLKIIMKKTLLCMASTMLLISGLATDTFALTGTTNSKIYKNWILMDNAGNTHGVEGHLFVDDTEVYCVDFYTDFHSGKTVTAGTYTDIGLTEEKAKRLAVIAYYGHKVPGRTDKDWYAITQGLLWREIHGTDDVYFVTNPTAPDLATMQRCWNEILGDVDRYYTAPSFSGTTQTVDSDGTITLTDTNGVLQDMIVANDGGLDVKISGNTLTIKGSTSVNEANIILRKNVSVSEMGTTVIYTASDCQALGSFKISDPFQSSFKINVKQFGNLELTKYNDDKSATVEDTSYRITGPNGYDKTYTTDSNGKIRIERLELGEYKAVETKAGNGYLINVSEKSFTIKANETTTVDFSNEEPTGRIELTKDIDTSKTDGLTGDAYLEGNTYELKAKERITNKAGTKTFYEKDELVSSKKTDENGKIVWDDLPLGDYYIQETDSNESLVLNNSIINVSLDYQGQTVSKVVKEADTSNRVNMQKIQVFKSGEKAGISGIVKGLQGAEFTFKLRSEVDHVGWDNATTYAVITTDENGRATTPYLPYGEYLVKETKTPKDYITAPDFTISVTDDYTEYEDIEQIKIININNRPFTSQVRLVKVDEETGKTVTLNSASFKIKDSEGNYVIQKVAGQKVDTFTTNSKNQIVGFNGKQGEVILPLSLDAGTYTIEEIKVPEGFLELEEPVTFTITNQYDYDVDQDEDPILTVKVKNSQPKGTLIVKKTDKVTADPLEEVEYQLIAKKDIISAIDGSVIYKKGDIVSSGKTNADGILTIDNLFMGTYELKETLTKEGYVLSEDVEEVVFEQTDTKTKEYVLNVDITNIKPSGKITIIKKDKDDDTVLEGIEFKVTAAEDIYSLDGRNTRLYSKGDVIDDGSHKDGIYITDESGQIIIENLPLGKYAVSEVKTLDGYLLNNEIYTADLSYDHSDKIEYTVNLEITNTKTKIEVDKKDQLGNGVEGASLQILDSENNIVEEWITDGSVHKIYGKLIAGQTYTLHEAKAPNDYYDLAEDQTFTVPETEETVQLEMEDVKYDDVGITKYDATNSKELPGAHLEIKDENGQAIDEWISTEKQHVVKLKVGASYTLTETIAPDGYAVAESITFTVDDNGEIVQQVKMYDELLPAMSVVKTGDTSPIILYGMLTAGSVLAVAVIRYLRKKED